jgi:hypothetical protein
MLGFVPVKEQKPEQAGTRARRGPRALLAVAILGLALALAPVAFQMFSRAPQGATMLSDFKPLMTTQRLDGFQQDLRDINSSVTELNGAAAVGRPDATAAQNAGYSEFAQQWPQINSYMTNLLDKVQRNLGNYQAVASLPSFTLFPWFFVIPGLLIAGLGFAAWRRPGSASTLSIVVAIIGVGLLLAPVAFQMFTRAPKGGKMMNAFTTIETDSTVTTIQGYFGTMASGQGTIRLGVVPALHTAGLSAAQIATAYPATTVLDHDWVHILNDMTPMIGAMSDNVGNYQAIKALPPFPLFPYFFALPGVVVIGLAFAGRRRSTFTALPKPVAEPATNPASNPAIAHGVS